MADHASRKAVPQDAGLLRSALVCDILDALGLRGQALGPDIVPLQPGVRLVGPAFTVASIEVEEIPETPYVGLLSALDAISSGQVFVLASGRTELSAMWGELLSTTCLARGVLGTVTDGATRDSEQIRELQYPLFARGTYPLDIHGRCEVTDFGQPVVIDGVVISPEDLVVADDDGVVVVPVDVVDDVIVRARAKAEDEGAFREAVSRGMLASEAYDRFKVL